MAWRSWSLLVRSHRTGRRPWPARHRRRPPYAGGDGGRHAGVGGRPAGPRRRRARTRWCGWRGPSPSRDRARSACACGRAVCAGRTSTSTEGDLVPRRPRVTPGHEVVGVVDRLGPGSTRWREGDRIGVPWLAHTCGICRFCLSGRENLCLRPRFTGWDVDGGYAEYAVVDEAYAYALPEEFDDVEVAPLLCAGIIGYRALLRAEPSRGRPARHLRVRWLRPPHGPGGAGPRRPRPRHDPFTRRRSSWPSSSAPPASGAPTPRRPSRSTRPSCSPRSAPSSRPRWPPWTGAGRWPSPAST